MASEIIRKLKSIISFLLVIIIILIIMLAKTSVEKCNTCTFESKTEAYYVVPEKNIIRYYPISEKKRKKV